MSSGPTPSTPWPTRGRAKISDAEVLADMAARAPLGASPPLTADLIYAAFLEAKKASDAWIKYYLASVMLMLLAAIDAIQEVSLPMTKLQGAFIGPAALVSFAICGLAYTNHELKMRLYRAVFDRQLAALAGPDRAAVLLRYPLAYTGASFLPFAARPDGVHLSWRQTLGTLQVAAALQLGWLFAVPGLMFLVIAAAFGLVTEPALPVWIKALVLAFLVGSLMFTSACLRPPRHKHGYTVAS
uniref:Uncharacterized protein n=1 Tax=Caulobacter sp. (strain K31) TaxID=366602 RepID=B0T915_CAUSK